MKAPRVYCDSPLSEGREISLEDERRHYLAHVLRLAPGAPLVLFNGRCEFASRVLSLDRREARVLCERALAPLPASRLRIQLYLSLSKGRSMDLAVQKATELGAASIQPVVAARSVVLAESRGEGRWERKLAHWRGIARAACEQCGRADLPEIAQPAAFDWIVAPQGAVAFVLDPDGERRLISAARALPGSCVAALIGPEGGLTEDELRAAREKGFTPVSLGPRLLRVETAVAASLSVLQALYGDMGGDSPEAASSGG